MIIISRFNDLFHQDDELYVYKTGEPHTHLEGYPKPVEAELGIQGPIDAAFVCGDHHIAHIVKGEKKKQTLNPPPPPPKKDEGKSQSNFFLLLFLR